MLLAVDPGVTCGVALLADDGTVLSTFTVSGTVAGVLKRLYEVHPAPDCIVIERPPNRSDSPYLTNLASALEQAFPDAEWLTPSQWKSTPRAKVAIEAPSVHERDAAHMGLEFQHRQHRSTR